MIHPLLRLIATEPQVLGDHVEAYAELVGDEVKRPVPPGPRAWRCTALRCACSASVWFSQASR